MNTEIRAQSAPWYEAVEILILYREHNKRAVAVNIEMKDLEPGARFDPSLRISREAAQMLINDLWHCGFRPTDGVDSVGELKATKYHLEDMRRMVFESNDGES